MADSLFESNTTETETFVRISAALLIGCMLVFGTIDILIGILILRNRRNLSAAVKAFTIVTLFMSLFEVTLILSFLTILIYPFALVILAVKFLKQPEMVEVV